MKANEKYFLNKNLDLKSENFLVKKGTLLEIVKLFDENDHDIETKIGVKFDNINGNYLIESSDFTNHLAANVIEKIPNPKFPENSCVTYADKGRGVVSRLRYDSFLEFYMYEVTIAGKKYVTVESDLIAC
jgi:hypothetical protein